MERKRRSDAGLPQMTDEKAEAQLVTPCCSEPPAGQHRGTLQLAVDELCRLKITASVRRETVRKSRVGQVMTFSTGIATVNETPEGIHTDLDLESCPPSSVFHQWAESQFEKPRIEHGF